MIEKELENKSAGYYAYAASRDARMKAIAMWSHYDPKQKIEADRVKFALELVYWAKEIHVNPRQKFISVKVDKAQIRDKVNLKFLEDEWKTKGYTKHLSPQGVIYRIPKI